MNKIDCLVNSIKEQSDSVNLISKIFEAKLMTLSFDKFNSDHWGLKIIHDSLVKVLHIVEKELDSTETLNVVSVARYICELNIQLNLIKNDSRYSLVYYGELIKNQREYWSRFKDQLDREVIAFNSLKKQEDKLINHILEDILQMPMGPEQIEALRSLSQYVFKTIDEKADRIFSIHAEQAKTNGYDFQAILIAKKQLPQVIESIKEIDMENTIYNSNISADIIEIVNSKMSWAKKSKKASLYDDYHFIYSFSSKLLHALPASISTNDPGLSNDEKIIFLKFIKIRMSDIMKLSQDHLKNKYHSN
ncbi:hypothetical protein PEC730217_22480 [Pectobacterium carotovorum subsp. carotovorum]|nr:hypothetical protein PEC730217_22480 [Pectobacterium carotovorum subsp. carotovorum]